MRTVWLTGSPSASLPGDVIEVMFRVFIGDSDSADESSRTVMNLTDSDGDGHPEAERANLPVGVPLTIEVVGLREGRVKGYVGRVGPIVLATGERRYVDLQMYEISVPINLESAAIAPRFMHTATTLPDGRVIVAGGFTSAEPAACPPDVTAPGAVCYDAIATDEAVLFDPTTGRTFPVQPGMLQRRGGHTATALPDGRVLLAGGAERMTFYVTEEDSGAGTPGFAPGFVPRTAAGTPGAHDTFEIFDAELNREIGDPDRDGDPARGGFTGSAGEPLVPGALNDERFMHAATWIPGAPDQVMLVGGLGGGEAAKHWEIYDDRRPGGYGVRSGVGLLATTRPLPGAATLSDSIWIAGSGNATSQADLAEIWTPDGGLGSSQAASDVTGFPSASMIDMAEHAEYNLVRPDAVAVGGGSHALVIGWLGSRCTAAGEGPLFPADEPTILCPHSAPPINRNYTVNVATGIAVPTETESRAPHAFGSTALLGDGRVVVTGGIGSVQWLRQAAVDLFAPDISGGRALPQRRFNLRQGRAFHQSTALPSGGILTTGGMTLAAGEVSLVSETEILFVGD